MNRPGRYGSLLFESLRLEKEVEIGNSKLGREVKAQFRKRSGGVTKVDVEIKEIGRYY
ncbi:MAG: hypothetical protein AB1567_09000 [bacterium]